MSTKVEFKKELEQLINRFSLENDSDTPDFILAGYIQGCLETYTETVKKRDEWFGFKPWENLLHDAVKKVSEEKN